MPTRINPNLDERIRKIIEALDAARVNLNDDEFESVLRDVMSYIRNLVEAF